jgi:hypothetical protein
MNNPTNDTLHELNELAGALREGNITNEQVARLDQLLADSPATLEAFSDLLLIVTEFRQNGASLGRGGSATVPNPVAPGRRIRRRAVLWALAAAASLALLAAGTWWSTHSGQQPTLLAARIVRSSGVKLKANGSPVTIPSEQLGLHVAHYELGAGILELEMGEGVRLVIHAPARFGLPASNKLLLLAGNVSARVPKNAVGFRIDTPSARVIDLGTEFGVSVDQVGSEIHVFRGEVLVQTPGDPDTLRLGANHASRTDKNSPAPRGIDYDPDMFLRSLGEAPTPYSRQVCAWNPVLYLPMDPPQDGLTLVSLGSAQVQVRIEAGRTIEAPFAAGRIGPALRLGGPTASTYAVASPIPLATEGQLTVCAWVRADSRPRWASIAKQWVKDFRVDRGGQFHFGLWHDDGDLEVHVHDAKGQEAGVREGVPLPLQRWHHVAFTLDGETLRLFRNGTEVASAPCAGLAVTGPQNLGIGVKLDADRRPIAGSTAGFWDGRIDELAVFHRALTAGEIRELYLLAEHDRDTL